MCILIHDQVVDLICDSKYFPFVGKGENHFSRVTVDVRDITNNSAVMDWIVPNSRVIDNYKVW